MQRLNWLKSIVICRVTRESEGIARDSESHWSETAWVFVARHRRVCRVVGRLSRRRVQEHVREFRLRLSDRLPPRRTQTHVCRFVSLLVTTTLYVPRYGQSFVSVTVTPSVRGLSNTKESVTYWTMPRYVISWQSFGQRHGETNGIDHSLFNSSNSEALFYLLHEL